MNCETFTGTLELLLRGDCDRCAQKLPNILSNIFGVPIPELNDDFCRGNAPIGTLGRFVVYCSCEQIISGRAPGRGPEGTGNRSSCYVMEETSTRLEKIFYVVIVLDSDRRAGCAHDLNAEKRIFRN